MLLAGCTQTPELALQIRLPADESGLKSVSTVNLTARRGSTVLAQSSFSASTRTVSLASVSHGSDTVVSLDGIDTNGFVIAHGKTCAIDFESGGMSAPLYFAPINFFAPTVNAPTERQFPAAVALPSGSVLVTGGSDGSSIIATSELFTPGAGTFATSTLSMLTPRWHAESVALPSIGALVVGGLDASGATIANGELFVESSQDFVAVTPIDARVEHRAVLSAASTSTDARVLITGGSDRLGGAPLDTTIVVRVLSDGSHEAKAGPTMTQRRRSHAAIAYGTSNVAVVFGGYDDNGAPLTSVEIVDFDKMTTKEIGDLAHARAEATATVTASGVLIAGGVGSDGKPRADAELFDILQRTSTVYDMSNARRGHSATLVGSEVLIAGGFDASDTPVSTTELFSDEFLTNRELGTARANHVAVPLCDDSVLVVGGGSGAELYSEPAN